ncbi:MAG: hypothetical protein KJ947_04420 [Alphaproteobacteria bacterium]|nr:hypothetical protein [Alphaproteobacteria bacterium]MBU1548809.1 hypothetical protein [Alphaproteobacteria bacterium]MBU2335635.1 hypothetical protein [Alphaproteobacteria bacterium]MBU2390970.1 hypothetical protein [Alphaproteobacteria bacterium]
MRLLYLIIATWFLMCPLGDARAENPTRDKCTCNLDPDDPPEDGAWVKNSAACWSTEVKEQNWCDIVVESLLGPQDLSTELLGFAASPSELVGVLHSKFDNFVSVSTFEGSIIDLSLAIDAVAARLKENEALLASCVTALANRKRGFFQDGEGGLTCRVSEASGWMRLEIPLEKARIAYMVAPPA